MRKHQSKRLTALLLALVLCLGLAVPAGAASTTSNGVKIEKVDNSAVSVSLTDDSQQTALTEEETPLYQDTDMVRVSIVLKGKSTLEKGFSTQHIAANSQAMAYRSGLQAQQETLAKKISKDALGGKTLDVVWNLTLAANIISANVAYGDIDAIKAVSGVEDVVLETRYEPQVASVDALDPNMATSGSMIGSGVAYEAGYTGAGTRIAVIDTGTDTDHQSFNEDAFQYAINEDIEDGKTVSLMGKSDIEKVLSQLNIAGNEGVTADSLYLNAKLPFAYNYVDGDFDVTHDKDSQGEHGSHVAGIATANRYIKNRDGTYSDALDVAHTQGVAPDAQLITMKVFGKGGGAYDADYMAAIEDAILLDCDSINLSLGSAMGGMSTNSTYQKILEDITKSDTVVSISAGNYGYWAEIAATGGYLYSDDVNFQTGGSPGTYTNSLAVASADNVGMTGTPLTVGENKIFYTESTYGNKALTTLDTDGDGTEYEFILFENTGATRKGKSLISGYADVIQGKIVLVNRGTSSFVQKHQVVDEAGGIACIVVNNEAGQFNMDLTDSTSTIPCIGITQADGETIKTIATAVKDDAGKILYYTGKMTISAKISSTSSNSKNYTMSDFSSWGVPGSLQLKPEITAPGGNIYSVNGADKSGTAYENMSGTSMAAPQVAGMAALAAQYLKESNVKADGLTTRALIQSLLMSTAVPMKTENGTYYPVIQQGAGLANVGDAINAHSYLTMDADATSGAADGKVKVELGDDPAKTGVYTFGFTLHDLSGKGGTYALSADVFTQDLFTEDGIDYLDTATAALEGAKVSFDQGSVALAAGGTAHVNVTIDVTGCDALKNYPCGTYIQAFVTVAEESTQEGVEGTTHTVPVLGFYGSWTDASMYDVGTNEEIASGEETRPQYVGATNIVTYAYEGQVYQRYFGENRYNEDESNLKDRNSLNSTSGDKLLSIGYTAIRNAGGSVIQAVDAETGEVYGRHEFGTNVAAFYYESQQTWMNYGDAMWFLWAGTDQEGNPLPDGTKVNYQMILAPEYYASEDGSYDWDALTDGDPSNGELGQGAYLGTTLTIDNTAPEVLSAEVKGGTLTVTAKDNRYLACVALTNAGGNKVLEKLFPNQQTANTEYTCDIDLSASYGKEFLLGVCDYAGNQTTYHVTLEEAFNGADTDGAILGATASSEWYAVKDGSAAKVDDADNTYYGAAYVGGVIYLSNSNGLYVADMDHLTAPTYLVSYPNVIVTGLAYDYNAETLYGAALSASTGAAQLAKFDLGSGAMTVIGDLPLNTNTLATDSKGNFYSIENSSGDLYTFTLDTLNTPALVGSTGYLNNYIQGLTYNNNDGQLYWGQYYTVGNAVKCDINGDGTTNADDAQLIVDYASGKLTEEEQANYNFSKANFNKDGRIDTFDAHLLLNLNTNNSEIAYLLRVDTEDASTQIAATLPTETAALFAPDDTTLPAALTKNAVASVALSQDTLSLTPTLSAQLTAFAAPWNLADTSVTWTSSDEDVATVDETGNVTARSVGTATVTAAASADPSVSASCTVTVTAVDVTITGALQDADRNAQFFTWNLGEDSTWTPGAALDNSVEAVVATPDGSVWQMDTKDYSLHQVNANGETLASYPGIGIPMVDLGYSDFFSQLNGTIQLQGAYQYFIYLQKDPTAFTSNYVNMLFYLMFYANAGEFVAVSSGVTGPVVDEEGNTRTGETFYLLDNVGDVWYVVSYVDGEGEPHTAFGYLPSDNLTYPVLTYPGEGANKNCSLVVADNGDLFFSYYNGSNNVLYRLTLNEDETMYNATLIADFGEGVRPASLLSATYNGTETADASANVISAADALFSGTVEELNAQSEAFAAQLDSTLTSFNANAGTAASTSAGTLSVTPGQGDSKSVTLDLNAENSTNGKLTVGYDTDVLTLTAVEPTDAALNSFVTAEDGTVTFAYANKTAVNGKLATLTFSYDASSAPKTTVATVTTLEEGGSQKEIAQKVTLTLKDEVVVPVGPTEPSKPSTPTEPEFPFKDITTDHPFYEDIQYVYEKGLMQGVSEDIFQSATTTTRGMIATILYRMEGEPAVKNASSFRDVADGMYYSKAVAWAAANGIVNGYADGTFQPDQTISREQMAAILYRYAQYKGCDVSVGEDTNILSYTDAAQVAEYAIPAFQWAVGAGIINGTTASTLSPKGSATRGQVAAILHRYCEWIG